MASKRRKRPQNPKSTREQGHMHDDRMRALRAAAGPVPSPNQYRRPSPGVRWDA